jgi:hypothetical protein
VETTGDVREMRGRNMSDFSRPRRGRLAAFALAALVIASMTLVATPASAENPPAGFLPDENSRLASYATILSDRFDGKDQLVHLSAVGLEGTDRVDFLVCPLTADSGGTTGIIEQDELSQCTLIGSDTTPNTPVQSTFTLNIDEAYELFWDIPTDLDTQNRDILMLACSGSGTVVSGAGQNCSQTLEEDIQLDDAAGGTADQSSSGEMLSICTADTDGPGTGTNPCNAGATTQGSTERAAIDALFKEWMHGDAVPDTGFVLRGTTSPDVTTPPSLIGYLGADANQDPDGSLSFSDACLLIETFSDRLMWECDVTDIQAGTGVQEAALSFDETGGAANGSGFCGGAMNGPTANGVPDGPPADCALDTHYTAITDRRVASIVQSWTGGGGHTHQPPSPPASSGCQPGETAAKSHSNSALTATENAEACAYDQFGDPGPAGTSITHEVTAPGTITACGGTPHDHDNSGSNEMCHATGAVTVFTIGNFNSTPGTLTVTSCVESEPAGTNHGCANESIKDNLTLSYGTQPSEVFLAFDSPAPAVPADPCRTGVTVKTITVGQHAGIKVCTFDSNGNPVPTDTNPFRLQWTITGALGEGGATAVRFNPSPPPSETTGEQGHAGAGIDGIQPGINFVSAFLMNEVGDPIDDFLVEVQVKPARDVPTNLIVRRGPKFIRGKAKTEDECQPGRQATLFRRRRGPDSVIGVDTTNALGRWGVRTGKRRGTYYARIAAGTATDVETGEQLNCLPDQSKDVRRQ